MLCNIESFIQSCQTRSHNLPSTSSKHSKVVHTIATNRELPCHVGFTEMDISRLGHLPYKLDNIAIAKQTPNYDCWAQLLCHLTTMYIFSSYFVHAHCCNTLLLFSTGCPVHLWFNEERPNNIYRVCKHLVVFNLVALASSNAWLKHSEFDLIRNSIFYCKIQVKYFPTWQQQSKNKLPIVGDPVLAPKQKLGGTKRSYFPFC